MGIFWSFLPYFSEMIEYNKFIFSRTLVHQNIFRLTLFRVFSNTWFARNDFITELNPPISAVQFSFATIFQDFKFVRFCSYSKFNLFYGCRLQCWKPFVDIFFHLREIGKQTLGNFKELALILSSESVNIQIRGVVAAVPVVKNHSTSTLLFSFCIYNNLFPLRFHFHALLTLQLNCEFEMLPFSGPE